MIVCSRLSVGFGWEGATWTTVRVPSLVSESLRWGDCKKTFSRDLVFLFGVSGGVISVFWKNPFAAAALFAGSSRV